MSAPFQTPEGILGLRPWNGSRFSACVREAAADQVRRGAAPVPQAVVLVRIYGCQGDAM